MALRATASFQRFEANNCASFEDALQGALNLLEDQGLAGVQGEPDVTIVLKQGAINTAGDKLVDTVVYLGATKEEIANDTLNPVVI